MSQIIGMPRNWLVARILVQLESEVQEKRHAHAIRTWWSWVGAITVAQKQRVGESEKEREMRKFSLDASEMFVN